MTPSPSATGATPRARTLGGIGGSWFGLLMATLREARRTVHFSERNSAALVGVDDVRGTVAPRSPFGRVEAEGGVEPVRGSEGPTRRRASVHKVEQVAEAEVT